MIVDNAPFSIEAGVNLRRIPPRQDAVSSLRVAVSDQIEGQHRDLAVMLDSGIDHVIVVDLYAPGKGSQVMPHGRQTVNPFLHRRIEIGDVRRVDFQVALGVASAPAIEGGTLHGDDFFSDIGHSKPSLRRLGAA